MDDLAWEWQPGDLVALCLRGDSTPTRGTIIRSDRTGVAVEWDDGEVTHVPPDRVAELQRAHHEDVR